MAMLSKSIVIYLIISYLKYYLSLYVYYLSFCPWNCLREDLGVVIVGVRFNFISWSQSLPGELKPGNKKEIDKKRPPSPQNAGKSTRSCKTSPDVGSVSIKWGNWKLTKSTIKWWYSLRLFTQKTLIRYFYR